MEMFLNVAFSECDIKIIEMSLERGFLIFD